MASTYFTKLTLYGAAQIAAATAGAPINLVAMAIGDGGGSETTPNDEQIQLVNETYRATLNRLVVDAKAATKLIAELIIPDSVGGWTMREVGIYDDKGKLFAVANTPPSYKPETSEGSAKTQVVRIVIKVSSTANITIFNDPSTVIATVEHVTDQFAARTVSAGTGLNGGGSLANNIELSVKYGATAGTAAVGNDPRLVNAILRSMLAQESGFANDVPMSQSAVTTFVDHQFGVLQLYIAYNFINNERVKQVAGTSKSDLMSQKAVTDALNNKVDKVVAVTGSITLNGTTNNTVVMTDIVTELSLDAGDVIRIDVGAYNKLHTVESITNNGSIIVNYEHAGNRVNGSLKLPDATGQATVTRIAKWFNASICLGRAPVNLSNIRTGSVSYINSTGREFLAILSDGTNGKNIEVSHDGATWINIGSLGNSSDAESVSFMIPDSWYCRAGGSNVNRWVEWR